MSDSQESVDWGVDSWRARAVWYFNGGTVLLTTLPIAFALFQGSTRSLFFLVYLGFLLALTSLGHRYPRSRAIAVALFWYSISIVMLHDAALTVPTSALSLAIAASLIAVLWGYRGVLVSVLSVVIVLVGSGLNLFQWRLFSPATMDTLLYDPTVNNYIRGAIFSGVQILVLALSVSYIARRQAKALEMLQQENRERQRAELAFQEAQRSELVSRITGGLAHNFGNALTVITTWTEMLQRNPDNTAYVERAAADMSEAARQATQVSKQVMTLSKNYVRRPEVYDVADALEPQINLLKTLLPANIGFESNIESGHYIRVDRGELQQAILNLVLNSRDAIDGEGRITLRLLRDGDDICLEVSDNGSGIEPGLLERIFEPFFSTKGAEGTGLGLASVRRSVENAGGRVDVVSQPGVGSTFSLFFEAREAPESATETTDAFDVGDEPGRNIIVADDEEIVLRALVAALEEAGHTTYKASDIREAIELIQSSSDIDLLVTDAIMPGGSVTELIAAFTERFPDSPVLVCSGYVEEDVLARDLSAGAFEFLQKPVSSSTLRNKVRSLLGRR
ncbi:MAG: ATP-binding protein [Pseudomonadota bacterium]